MSWDTLHDPSRWAPKDEIYAKFFAAAENDKIEDVKLCLETHEINVDLLNDEPPYGWNALHYAAMNGNADMIELLLTNGADVNELDSNTDGGGIALHYAAYSSHITAMRLLIDHGSKVDVFDGCGCIPLHAVLFHAKAVESKHRKAIKSLVEAGSDIFAVHENNGETVVSPPMQSVLYFTDFSIVDSSSSIR